jgi:Ca2+-binding EF-hand superfamily protein
VGSRLITRESFKKNMGILGLHCAQDFSERMFNAFDLDNDEKVLRPSRR